MTERSYMLKDITGKKLNRLTALYPTGEKCSNGDALWVFQCDCGNTTETSIGRFNFGHTKSCGCIRKESAKNREDYHGMCKSPEYKAWLKIKERCNNENCKQYAPYGANGIGMCKSWENSFQSFYDDMGPKPAEGYSIDRIDGSKGYHKENCRWSSRYVQSRNRTSNVGTSKYKGVQYDKKERKWIATISLGNIKARKIGRYLKETDAAAAYNLATEMIFGKDSSYTVVNDLSGIETHVNMKGKFFDYWVFKMKDLYEELYAQG